MESPFLRRFSQERHNFCKMDLKSYVLSIGTTGNPAAKAVKMAKEQGIDILHYNMRFLKPLDYNALEGLQNALQSSLSKTAL